MSLYPVDGHPLLTAAAAALDADVLEEQALLAEDLLGLSTTSYTDDDADRAARAVALQVGYQVERGMEATVYEGLTRGSRTFTYYRDAGLLHPTAAELVAALQGTTTTATGTYAVIRSYR